MKRRHAALALATGPPARPPRHWLAVTPVEGENYSRLSQPVPVAVAGKIEVIEFFGYWCPHCAQLETGLEAWVKKLPADVNFRRIPAGWAPFHEPYKKLYFALEAMGVPMAFHSRVFGAVPCATHQAGNRRRRAEVRQRQRPGRRQAGGHDEQLQHRPEAGPLSKQLFQAYRGTGVPMVAVNGRFTTGPERVRSGEADFFALLDSLIAMSRTRS